MELFISKKHILFYIALFFTLMTLLLYQIDELPMAMQLRKTKYLYVVFVAVLILLNDRMKKDCIPALIVLVLFILHTFLFGWVFNITEGAKIAADNIHTNVTQMMWFLLIVLVTYLYVAQNGIFKGFITVSYWASGLQLLIAGLKHRGDFVNPVWGLIQAFTADIRYKTTFGFVHAGYLSNACYLVLLVSVFYFEFNRRTETKTGKIVFWTSFLLFDGLAAEMLMCAAERSGIISSFMVFAIYFFFVFCRFRLEKKTKVALYTVVILLLLLLIPLGVYSYIWNDSNRVLNITVNYPVFQALGNKWIGMGYVDNAGFHADVLAFGVKTSSLDLYYVYIFFTTGIIGCILIGTALILITVYLLKNKRSWMNIAMLAIYLSMIFFAFWQCNMATYRYVSPTILLTIVLCGMSNDCCAVEYIPRSDKGKMQEIEGGRNGQGE